MVIWVTGLSAVGKTTLCQTVFGRLKPRLPELVSVDGDQVRALFGGDLGHGEADRVVQIKRIQSLAAMLDAQGLVVLVAALYAHPDLLAWNRANFSDYVEVYLEASVDTARSRDPRGLYSRYDAGQTRDVVGLDIPWRAPVSPDLVLDAASGTPDSLADRLIAFVPRLAGAA
ncbi:hypothetical protein A6A04_06845 [Paramagnetospirillum marisnigri]|uniref:APS kinase domain-containing protein n=1 Tax=Paramagnetospirillum marisnigri TaxID=1285242 RepID=A0A178MC63_9PROT|nr:adenylyl-sulfate kinase [Paramagnetospirillum marisnigri]OAN45608.1 hypothetical protein A6A04_06845 [Paramagnetospirillum marisnigri]